MIIDCEKKLKELVIKAMRSKAVAIDTEFVWDRTYYPKLGLVQIGYADGSVDLIDGIAIKDFSALGQLIADPNTIKIFHDAIQDLTILCRICKTFPLNVFDTQRASGFIGLGASISLAELIKEILNIHVDKSQTQSNWCARPLSAKQISYAKEDVCHGVRLMNLILKRAEILNHKKWVLEEMKIYELKENFVENTPEEMSPKVKNSGSLSIVQRKVLKSLFIWREHLARKENLPRTFILKDEYILSLSRNLPDSIKTLKERNLGKRFHQKFINSLWETIQNLSFDVTQISLINEQRFKKDDIIEAQVDLALAFLKGISLNAKIDPVIVANRNKITQFVYMASKDPGRLEELNLYRGWRKSFCGKSLFSLLNGMGSIYLDKKSLLPKYRESSESIS